MSESYETLRRPHGSVRALSSAGKSSEIAYSTMPSGHKVDNVLYDRAYRVRLLKELGILRHRRLIRFWLPGSEHNSNPWPMIAGVLSKQHAIHRAGQIDVRKERANTISVLFEELDRVKGPPTSRPFPSCGLYMPGIGMISLISIHVPGI
jgi:hypothetical protein